MDLDKKDLSLSGPGGDFLMLEYIEERPPVLMNVGMASVLINYFRPAFDTQDRDQEDGDMKGESGAAAGESNHRRPRLELLLTRRLPRHVRLLLQQREATGHTYDHDANTPRLEYGETKVLSFDDEQPFLGPISENEVIPSLLLWVALLYTYTMYHIPC